MESLKLLIDLNIISHQNSENSLGIYCAAARSRNADMIRFCYNQGFRCTCTVHLNLHNDI